MNFGSIYFFLLLGSGFISCVLGTVFWKDLWDRSLSNIVIPVQVTLLLWFLVFCALWIGDSNTGSVFGRLEALFSILLIAILHTPMAVSFSTKIVTNVFMGMIEPKSGIVLKKSYDEAEKAVARHEYAKALELYRNEKEQDPDDSQVRVRIGEVLVKTGQLKEAIKEFRGLLKMDLADEEDLTYAILRAAEIYAMDLRKKISARSLIETALRENLSEESRSILNSRLKTYS